MARRSSLLRRTKSLLKDVPIESAEEAIANSDMTAVDSGLDVQLTFGGNIAQSERAIQYVKLEGLSVRGGRAQRNV